MNTNIFSFNQDKYNLWDIYKTIQKYYPIGLSKLNSQKAYLDYEGIKKMEELIVENIHNKKNYEQRWEQFTTQIGVELDKKIVGTTYGQAPSFSSKIVLEENSIEKCTHTKELHFALSLLGEFYQIYGVDGTLIRDVNDQYPKGYYAVNVITTSPYKEFEDAFNFVESKIKAQFPGYRIIPYDFGQTILKGLEVRYIDDIDCSINKALFNQFLSPENISKFATRGEKNYGKQQWLKGN